MQNFKLKNKFIKKHIIKTFNINKNLGKPVNVIRQKIRSNGSVKKYSFKKDFKLKNNLNINHRKKDAIKNIISSLKYKRLGTVHFGFFKNYFNLFPTNFEVCFKNLIFIQYKVLHNYNLNRSLITNNPKFNFMSKNFIKLNDHFLNRRRLS